MVSLQVPHGDRTLVEELNAGEGGRSAAFLVVVRDVDHDEGVAVPAPGLGAVGGVEVVGFLAHVHAGVDVDEYGEGLLGSRSLRRSVQNLVEAVRRAAHHPDGGMTPRW